MPIEPIDPSKQMGSDGKEKYTPEEKRGPGKFDELLDKAKMDRVRQGGSGIGGGSAAGDTRFLKPKYKAGGKVSSASKRADGCCVKGKTRGRMV
jgi:hypothetical protein